MCYIHGEPTSRAHTVFSFSLIKQQKTKTNKTNLIPQTSVPKGQYLRMTVHLPKPMTAAG